MHISRLLRISALLALPLAALAQYAPPPPPRPFPGFANEKLRAADPYMAAWDIAANYRIRFEDKLGAGFTDAGSNWDFSKRLAGSAAWRGERRDRRARGPQGGTGRGNEPTEPMAPTLRSPETTETVSNPC